MRAFVVLSLIAVAAAGCKRANDKFCDADTLCEIGTCNLTTFECEVQPPDAGIDAATCGGDPDCIGPSAPICDDGSGICRGCATPGECLAKDPATPECDTAGRCVECLDSAACGTSAPICADGDCERCTDHPECVARDAVAPKCASDGTCVECTEHADCTSGVCDRAANTCLDATAVIYVDTGGSDDKGCGGIASECQTINFALGEVDTGRTTLLVAPGTYSESVVANGVTATIVGPTTAIVSGTVSNQAVLLLFNSSDITVDGLTLRGAFGGSDADGINCESTSSTITAFRTLITENGDSGVDVRSGCVASLEEVTIRDNAVNGLFVDSSTLRIHRSIVDGNDRGGIDLEDSSFDIVNNFIVLNGEIAGVGSIFGGVRIELAATQPTMVFEFNTVAENVADETGSIARGVVCFVDTTFANNIVYGGAGAPNNVSGSCTWAYSDVEGGVTGGEGNIDEDPRFVDVAAKDFHIENGSPCKDEGDENATLDIDFDGDERPNGSQHDMGADEVN